MNLDLKDLAVQTKLDLENGLDLDRERSLEMRRRLYAKQTLTSVKVLFSALSHSKDTHTPTCKLFMSCSRENGCTWFELSEEVNSKV